MDIILKYFTDLSDLQKERFEALGALYKEWNEKINLISRKDIDALYERHILHSLGIAKVMNFKDQTNVLDVGTGGGFPGIPLAIIYPEANFHLVDTIGKKITVVKALVEALDLENVIAEQKRAENVEVRHYDFILARAVKRTKTLLDWTWNKVSKNSFNDLHNGLLLLKGGNLVEELEEVKKKHTIYNLSDYFDEEFFETKKVVHMPLNL